MGKIKITEAEMLQRKLRIIHCAFHLFCQYGIDKVTVRQIAEEANVSEKSVYRYYSSKLEILRETSKKVWGEIIAELIGAIDESYDSKTGYEQVEILLDSFLMLSEKKQDYVLFSYEFRQNLLSHSIVLKESDYDNILAPIGYYFLDALKKGEEDKSIVLSEDAESLFSTIWGLMRGYVTKIVLYDNLYDGPNYWKEHFDIAKGFILSGLKNGLDLGKAQVGQ